MTILFLFWRHVRELSTLKSTIVKHLRPSYRAMLSPSAPWKLRSTGGQPYFTATSAPHLQERCRRAEIATHADRLGADSADRAAAPSQP